MTRRYLLLAPALAACRREEAAEAAAETVRIVEFDAAGNSKGLVTVEKIVRSNAEWRQTLSPVTFWVTREAGTETPFSGEYDRHHGPGVFRCVCCGTPAFDGETKFNSGTGWPSFWQPIAPQNILKRQDGDRVEVLCVRCDAHLGHVFDDGPPPTGLRYCINSIALRLG